MKILFSLLIASFSFAETFDAIIEAKYRPEVSKNLVYLYRPNTQDRLALEVKGEWKEGQKVRISVKRVGREGRMKVERIEVIK